MIDYIKIGERIRDKRKACHLSQENLAEKASISVTHMSHIETAGTKLSLPVLVDIADALGVTTDELLFGKNSDSDCTVDTELKDFIAHCSAEQLSAIKFVSEKINKLAK